AYRAFRLLAAIQPQLLDHLPNRVWARWAPAIVAFPNSGTEDEAVQAQLVCMAYQRAPDDVLRGLENRLQLEIREGWLPMAQRLMAGCWDVRTERLLIDICTKPEVQGPQF